MREGVCVQVLCWRGREGDSVSSLTRDVTFANRTKCRAQAPLRLFLLEVLEEFLLSQRVPGRVPRLDEKLVAVLIGIFRGVGGDGDGSHRELEGLV